LGRRFPSRYARTVAALLAVLPTAVFVGAVGLACTFSALAAYGTMTLSRVENARPTLRGAAGFVVGQRAVVVGGPLRGPLFRSLGSPRRGAL
jgi:hypothetical protein